MKTIARRELIVSYALKNASLASDDDARELYFRAPVAELFQVSLVLCMSFHDELKREPAGHTLKCEDVVVRLNCLFSM